jgi:hypothetical protein
MEYGQAEPIQCPKCNSVNTTLIDVLIDLHFQEGTNPVRQCQSCNSIFDNRPAWLINRYSSCWAHYDQSQEILRLVIRALSNGNYDSEQFKKLFLDTLFAGDGFVKNGASYSIDEYAIRNIVDSQVIELKQKIDELCADSLLALKAQINTFKLDKEIFKR